MPEFILEHTRTGKTKRLVVAGDEILVGRATEAQIPLADRGVSKRHLLIRRTGSGYEFEDLGSRNGTVLNDTRQERGTLSSGDVLSVGRLRITFLLEPSRTPEAVGGSVEPAPADTPSDPGDTGESPGEVGDTVLLEGASPAAEGAATRPGTETTPPTSQSGPETAPEPPGPPASASIRPDGAAHPGSLRALTGDWRRVTDAIRSTGQRVLAVVRAHAVLFAVFLAICVIGFGVGLGVGLGLMRSPAGGGGRTSIENAPPAPEHQAPPTAESTPTGERATSPVEPVPPDGTSGERSPQESRVPSTGSASRPGVPSFPGLVADPLGAYPGPEESERVLYRLFLDLLDRPPTRKEARTLGPRSHGERWNVVRRLSRREGRLPHGLGQTFLVLLGREPDPDELDAISNWTAGQFRDLGLWLSATREYRSPAHRRERDLEQLSSSLLVDLRDRLPESGDELEMIRRAVLEFENLGEIARVLSGEGVAAPPEPGALREWIRAEIFRGLQRFPDDRELSELTRVLTPGGAGPEWLREALVSSTGYRRY